MVAALNDEKNSLIAQLRQPRASRRSQQLPTTHQAPAFAGKGVGTQSSALRIDTQDNKENLANGIVRDSLGGSASLKNVPPLFSDSFHPSMTTAPKEDGLNHSDSSQSHEQKKQLAEQGLKARVEESESMPSATRRKASRSLPSQSQEQCRNVRFSSPLLTPKSNAAKLSVDVDVASVAQQLPLERDAIAEILPPKRNPTISTMADSVHRTAADSDGDWAMRWKALYQGSEKKNDDLSSEVAKMMVLITTKDLEINGLRKQQRQTEEHAAVS